MGRFMKLIEEIGVSFSLYFTVITQDWCKQVEGSKIVFYVSIHIWCFISLPLLEALKDNVTIIFSSPAPLQHQHM
jgi:hypothetical protein